MPNKKVRQCDGMLSKLIAERIRVSQAHGEFIVDNVFEAIRDLVLTHNKSISIPKFGKFVKKEVPSGYRNLPFEKGKRVWKDGYHKIAFRGFSAASTKSSEYEKSVQEPETSTTPEA